MKIVLKNSNIRFPPPLAVVLTAPASNRSVRHFLSQPQQHRLGAGVVGHDPGVAQFSFQRVAAIAARQLGRRV
ncbi:hypothetical protein AB4084_41515, partial [Lysobacter sp. 2RAB21]